MADKCSKESRCEPLARVLLESHELLTAKRNNTGAIIEPDVLMFYEQPYPSVYVRPAYRKDGKTVRSMNYVFKFCPFCGEQIANKFSSRRDLNFHETF